MRDEVHRTAPTPVGVAPTIGLFAVVAGVHLTAQLLGATGLAGASQVLLMPALAIVLLSGSSAPRRPLVRLALLALGCSWLGDTAPRLFSGDASFLAMVAFFLAAQVVYALAFWPFRGASLLRRPPLLTPYVVAAVVIIVLCAPAAGALLGAVIAYAAAICVMAVLATGLGPAAGIGAALFVVSDAAIALDAFGVLTLPGQSFWVMSTYIAAQLLLVLAVRRRARGDWAR